MNDPSIYSFVKTEESRYETEEVRIGDNWMWNMRDHIQLLFHLVNGIFYTGDNDYLRAFKNVMESTLNLAFWTEDIEVKDVVFFIEDNRVLSFFLKKYHDEVYTREHDLDKLFDDITESDLTYGGVVTQRTSEEPKVIPLQSIAFADQTDLMGSPIGFKHYFTPDKLRGMAKNGWGDEENGATISLDDLAILAEPVKDSSKPNNEENQLPGKVVEVYIIRGNLPEHYLEDNDNMEDWYNQVHVVGFYTDKNNKKVGVTLYRKKEEESNLKFFSSKPVYNRALGRGVGEALLHPQVWTNFLSIHKMNLIEAASKVPLVTDDDTFADENKIIDMENLQVMKVGDGKTVNRIDTAGVNNINLISNAIDEWYQHAQLEGSAFDPLLGKEQPSGTTFRGQERTVKQGRGIHDRRRGQRAKHIEELYRDWIIDDMIKKILKGKKFMATLTTDELSWVVDQLVTNEVNRRIREKIIEGKVPGKEEKAQLKEIVRETFQKKGNRHLIEILEGEFKDIEIKVGINIAGKQKDLPILTDKLLSIFQFVFANPQAFQQAMQNKALASAFQDILEYSGLSQTDFMALTSPTEEAPAPQQQVQQAQQMQLNQPQE